MTDGMSNHYPQRQITEIQLRYVTINQTLTELFYYLNLLRHTSVYYLQNNFFLSFCTSKGGFTIKARSFKKFFVSIALSAVLTLSSASSVFAATAQLAPAEQSVEQAQSDDSDTPAIESSDAQNACASLTAQPGIRQTAASENSVTIQWNPVTNASKYAVNISPLSSSSYRFLGYIGNTRNKAKINKLKAGTAYVIKITALNSSGIAISSRTVGCTTLYSKVKIKSSYASTGRYTFNMQTVNPSNSITGYKVVYQSSAAHKLITKYFNTRYSFTIPISGNTFYQVKIYPYLVLGNKRYVSSTSTDRYISNVITLQKAGNTNSSMSVKWNRTAGADNYSIYIKYPGSSSFKKVKTTTSNFFTLTRMKKNTKYGIKVIANKKVKNKVWHSDSKAYNMSLV